MLSKDQLLSLYHKMLLIRRFEEKAGQLYGMGEIGGFCHLYIGQEAVAVGVAHCMKKGDDSLITSYRDHGMMLACGSDPASVMAELLGREDGCSGGKGGSMHVFDLDKGFFGGHGIVGAQVPLGTGIGFANKYKKNAAVSVVCMGDGAVSQGQVYESFNMASLWKLPVLYIIENNMYGMGTSVKRSAASEDLFNRGESFGISGQRVDGMKVESVIQSVQYSLDRIRSGNGPELIEFCTYRFRGHSMSDPANYRSREELDYHKKESDPIALLKTSIAESAVASIEELKIIDNAVKNDIKNASEFALRSSPPKDEVLYHNIVADS